MQAWAQKDGKTGPRLVHIEGARTKHEKEGRANACAREPGWERREQVAWNEDACLSCTDPDHRARAHVLRAAGEPVPFGGSCRSSMPRTFPRASLDSNKHAIRAPRVRFASKEGTAPFHGGFETWSKDWLGGPGCKRMTPVPMRSDASNACLFLE
eukprot:scaffold824_cov327-Pavlova_lutheri.AAC.34